MKKDEIRFSHYRHAEGGTYIVIGTAQMKNPHTREWEPAVIYQADPLPLDERVDIYVRTEADFQERFTEVRDSNDGQGPEIRTH